MTKRILREMRIMELSAVDNPAQEGATFVLAKRAKDEDMTMGAAPDDEKPKKPGSCNCDKPQAEDGKCKKCGKPMGKGLTDPPEDNAKLDDTKSGEDTMTDAEKLAAAEAALATEIAKGEKLTKVATLSDVEKDHYNCLVELDAEGADKFLDASKETRAVEIEKAKNADPVIYTDSEGHEYHKSEAKAASLAKRADDMAKENKALREKETAAEFEKRAAEYPNLKGETVAKVALLRAIDGVADEATRTAITEMLKANDAGLGEAMKTLGTKSGPTMLEPEAKLNKMAEEKATAEKISFAKAFDAVVQTPEGEKLYTDLIMAKMPKAVS